MASLSPPGGRLSAGRMSSARALSLWPLKEHVVPVVPVAKLVPPVVAGVVEYDGPP